MDQIIVWSLELIINFVLFQTPSERPRSTHLLTLSERLTETLYLGDRNPKIGLLEGCFGLSRAGLNRKVASAHTNLRPRQEKVAAQWIRTDPKVSL